MKSKMPFCTYARTDPFYNSKGKFNTSHHFGRKGIEPQKLTAIVHYYHGLFKSRNVEFRNCSYGEIQPQSKNDLVYLDPPYSNNKSLYFGNIDIPKLENWISALPCPWFLNFNGINEKDNEEKLSIGYTNRIVLDSGKSAFRKLQKAQINVSEYLYFKK